MTILPPSTCHYCEDPAIAFCDFVVDSVTWATCDRALCPKHCRRVGFLCTRPRSKSDTIDHCRMHQEDAAGT